MSEPASRRPDHVAESTTTRLSIYLRCLRLLERQGVERVSSKDLAEQFNLNSALIRKDLAYFGEFGVRGVGYNVAALREQITRLLGLDREIRVIILGAGNLGQALSAYRGFNSEGCRIVALFDISPRLVGTLSRDGVPVHHPDRLEEVIAAEQPSIAILAVPEGVAQDLLDRLGRAGIRAVLNFVPERLRAPEGTHVRDVDLKIHLEGLAFHLARLATE